MIVPTDPPIRKRQLYEKIRSSCSVTTCPESSQSSHSTLSASISSCPSPIREKAAKEKKTVRFSRKVRARFIRSHKIYDDAEWTGCWYSSKEQQKMRSSARRCVTKASTGNALYLSSINKAMKNARFLAETRDERRAQRLLRDRAALASEGKDLHAVWNCKEYRTFRGLEDLISGEHRHVRNEISKESRDMVVEMSKFSKDILGDDGIQLAVQYREMTRTAAILARLFGEADAFAVAVVKQNIKLNSNYQAQRRCPKMGGCRRRHSRNLNNPALRVSL